MIFPVVKFVEVKPGFIFTINWSKEKGQIKYLKLKNQAAINLNTFDTLVNMNQFQAVTVLGESKIRSKLSNEECELVIFRDVVLDEQLYTSSKSMRESLERDPNIQILAYAETEAEVREWFIANEK